MVYRFFILILLIVSVFITSCKSDFTNFAKNTDQESQIASEKYGSIVGMLAPKFNSMSDVNGKLYNLEDFRGKNLLLIFETTFCSYCLEEKLEISKFINVNANKIEVLAIDIGEDKEIVSGFIHKNKINYPWLLDQEGVLTGFYTVTATPKHFFIDKNGYIRAVISGYADYNKLQKGFESL